MKGFTLIELLTVIGIVSFLGVMSQPTFVNYSNKAVDATKQQTIASALKMIYYDVALNDSDLNYVYGASEFDDLLTSSGYGIFPVDQDNCFFMANGVGPTNSSKDNKIAIMVWGETTSTANPGEAGLLIDGDQNTVNYFLGAGVTEDDLKCNNAWVWQPPALIATAHAAPKKAEVCHNNKTLVISQNAVSAHLNHGDSSGACPAGGGVVEDGDAGEENEAPDDPAPVVAESDGEGNTLLEKVAGADMGSIKASLMIDPDGNILEIEREGF